MASGSGKMTNDSLEKGRRRKQQKRNVFISGENKIGLGAQQGMEFDKIKR
jgi:hypothetical protein